MSFTSRRDVYLIAGSKGVSWFGDEVATVALLLRLQAHGAGAPAVAALLVAAALPLLLLAGVVGRLVDRCDSRALLLASGTGQALACLALTFTTATPAILALIAVLGCGQAVNAATWQALLATAAGSDLPRAVGFGQLGMTAAGILAPATAGLLTAAFGTRVPLLVDTATFVAIVVVGAAIATRRGGQVVAGEGDVPVADDRGGFALVLADPVLRRLFALLGTLVLLGSMVNVIEVFLVRGTLHAGTFGYGMCGASYAAGALGGALLAARLAGDRALARGLVAASALLAAALASFALAPTLAWVFPAAVLAGVGNGVLNVTLVALVMGRAGAAQRGRIAAVLTGVASGTQLAAFAAGGALALVLTPREIFALGGLLGLLAPAVFGAPLLRATAGAAPAAAAAPAAGAALLTPSPVDSAA